MKSRARFKVLSEYFLFPFCFPSNYPKKQILLLPKIFVLPTLTSIQFT